MKGMQLDGVYREFHGQFLEETSILMNFITSWTATISADADGKKEIPEDVVGDIESFIGQAKLLLDSKLPQFAQLLYFYLSRKTEPHVILPCDLEGWWAVAEISIDKVKKGFAKIEEKVKVVDLQSNQF